MEPGAKHLELYEESISESLLFVRRCWPVICVSQRIIKANCEEKTRLLVAYQTATGKYSTAVSDLARKMGTTPQPEYEKLNRLAEEARYESLDARDRLDWHTAEHGC